MAENQGLSVINTGALSAAKNEMSAIAASSAQKEAEAMRVAMVVAKQFPRDVGEVEDKIMRHCRRTRFAENAEFSFRRGGSDIKGPSIKLMEAMAQCYGNIQHDIKELKRYSDYSECEAFAWDMENNVKSSRSFSVPHYRDTKGGKVRLTEDRDIREMIFNYGSRNLRACLERVIPRDLTEQAIDECRVTLSSDKTPLGDRIEKSKRMFKDFEVGTEFLEKLVGEKSENWTNSHLKQLAGYYTALKEGDATVKDLEAHCVESISKTQITELAGLIGSDKNKIAILEGAGYKMSELKKIPKNDYDSIKALFDEKKPEVAAKKEPDKK